MAKLQKKPKTILLTKKFGKKLETVDQVLRSTQYGRSGFLNLKVPYPFSVGDELEYRYEQYSILKTLIKQLLQTYVPIQERSVFLQYIDKSPMEDLISTIQRNPYLTSTLLVNINIEDLMLCI